MPAEQNLKCALMALRYGVFIVMLVWTVDKLVNPQHTAAILEHIYFIPRLDYRVAYLLATAELILLFCFILGIFKPVSYGAVLLFHGASTLFSFPLYLAPFEDSNLLFFAAWPMLAACYALFVLREADTLFTLSGGRR